jgi:hypothetical protein
MPRYFFNIVDGRFLVDHEGTELSGLDEMRVQAIDTAGAMLREAGRSTSGKGPEWQMHVTDEAHKTVLKLCFSVEEPQ